jgi:hypothetical protein
MAEVSLDSVVENINSINVPLDLLAKSLDDVQMESNTGDLAVNQIKDLIEKQSSMSAKEQRASRKQIDGIAKLIQDSSEIGDSDKQRFSTILQQHDQRIKSDASLMGEVGNQLSERLTESVTNIGAVVAGVVSDSPILALGVKFMGDSVLKGVQVFKNFRKKKKEEKEIRERQRELFKEQEKIDEEERRVLREQISESDVQNRLNLSEQDIQKRAEESNRTREQIYNEEKDRIIEQSKIAKQRKDNAEAEAKRIKELKEKVGLVDVETEQSENANERVSAAVEEIIQSPNEDQITGESGSDIPPNPNQIRSESVESIPTPSEETISSDNNQGIVVNRIENPVEVEESSDKMIQPIVDVRPLVQGISQAIKDFLDNPPDEEEMDSIENERERGRSEEESLKVEKEQNNRLGDLIENAGNQDSEGGSIGKLKDTFTKGFASFAGMGRGMMAIPSMIGKIFNPLTLKIAAVVAGIALMGLKLFLLYKFFTSDFAKNIGNALLEGVRSIISSIKESLSKLPVIGHLFKEDGDEEKTRTTNRRGRRSNRSSTTNENITSIENDSESNVSRFIESSENNVVELNSEEIRNNRRSGNRRNRTRVLNLESPEIAPTGNENVTVVSIDTARRRRGRSQNRSQEISGDESTFTPSTSELPSQGVSGVLVEELNNVTSAITGSKNAAAMSMKESAIEKSASTNISPILNNLSNVTNNNVSNSSSTVIPTKAYNTENSFNKINSALSGAV